MFRQTTVKANIPVIYMKEADAFICYSPAFDLVAHGDSFGDAEKSFAVILRLFAEEVTKKGTWKEVLKEYGWKKVKHEWSPPRIVKQENRIVEIPTAA